MMSKNKGFRCICVAWEILFYGKVRHFLQDLSSVELVKNLNNMSFQILGDIEWFPNNLDGYKNLIRLHTSSLQSVTIL